MIADTTATREAFSDTVEQLKALLDAAFATFKYDVKEAMESYYIDIDVIEWERQEQAYFREYASNQAAARAKAYKMQMTNEKARQVMRLRKLLHA